MYVIGIDISKYKHDCIVINEAGEVKRAVFSFNNDWNGFNHFLSIIHSLDPTQEKRIGFEATGHYQDNLKVFLEQSHLPYMELNALLVHKFRTAQTLRGVKTDKTDAELIARYLSQVDFIPYPLKAYHVHALRSLTKRHFDLVGERTKYLIRITNFLDRTFPEFKPFFKGNLKSKTALFILDKYSLPEKIATIPNASYERLRSISRGRFKTTNFFELKEVAKNTVGFSSESDVFEIKSLLRFYHVIDDEISLFEDEIARHLSKINTKISSIPGIGLVSAATIVAAINDINRFESPDKLLAYAGLDPRLYQSGTSSYKGRMNKKGSVSLRRVLMNTASSSLMLNSVLSEYYRKKKLDEGKPHRVALSHLARKLVRIIYKLETEQIDFDPSFLR